MSRFDALGAPQRRILDAIRAIARARAITPFLVGGPVRDLLLARPAGDLDVAVERDAEGFVAELARRLQGTVRAYPRFLTFKVDAPDLPPIDIATTRRESYPEPGALPVVAPASLTEDLLRRDFSINAIAIDLTSEEIVDPANGVADIEARAIRILDDRSFVDDPTRIFRAIRLAVRLDFAVEPATRARLDEAIASGALESVSRERRFRELQFAMREPAPAATLHALADAGALRDLLGIDAADRAALGRAEKLALAHPELDRELLLLAALAPKQITGLGLSASRIETLRALEGAEALAERIARVPHEEAFALLDAASPELRALVATAGADASRAIAAWERYRAIPLDVRGDELGVAPGPHIAKAIARTRLALFLNEIASAEARAFASRAALEYLESSKTRP